jgi:hypothetical protein
MAKETAGDKKDNAGWSQIVASKLLWQARLAVCAFDVWL